MLQTYVRYEVLTAVKMLMLVTWFVKSYGLVGRHQSFEEKYCRHLHSQRAVGIYVQVCMTLQSKKLKMILRM
jgi:hypothetical protein